MARCSGPGFGGSVRGGTRIEADGWGFEPTLGVRVLALSQAGLAERGTPQAGMNIASQNLTSVQTLLGMTRDRRIQVTPDYALLASMQLGCAYEMAGTAASVNATFSAIPGARPILSNPSAGQSAMTAGVRANLETGTALSGFAGYSATMSTRSTSQNLIAGVRGTGIGCACLVSYLPEILGDAVEGGITGGSG